MVECGDQVWGLTARASARTSDRLAVQGDHPALLDGEGRCASTCTPPAPHRGRRRRGGRTVCATSIRPGRYRLASPNEASFSTAVSAAHCPIAANERHPAKVAVTASGSTPASGERTPRGSRGSGTSAGLAPVVPGASGSRRQAASEKMVCGCDLGFGWLALQPASKPVGHTHHIRHAGHTAITAKVTALPIDFSGTLAERGMANSAARANIAAQDNTVAFRRLIWPEAPRALCV